MRLRSADPTWAPAIDAGYLTDERDLDALVCGVEKAREIASVGPLADVLAEEWSPGAGVTGRDALVAFVYGHAAHRAMMARRREWFDRMENHLVLWWVPAGHRPDFAEARDRLDPLRGSGPTPEAFTIAKGFPAPGG